MKNNITKYFEYLKREIRMLFQNPIDYIMVTSERVGDIVHFYPYNPKLTEIGNVVIGNIKKEIPNSKPLLVGSAGLKIESNSKDVDILVPYESNEERNQFLPKLTMLFGTPSVKNNRFVKWENNVMGLRVEVIMGNTKGRMFNQLLQAYKMLSGNEKNLKEYIKLKKDAEGISSKEYHKRTLDFFNKIIMQ